ncbi:AAA-like domain-containing protein, partial [Ruminococcus flavefaciens]
MGKFSFEAFANYENYDSIAQSSDAMLPQRTSWPIGQYSFETVKSKKAGVPVGVMDKIFSGDVWLEPKAYLDNYSKRGLTPRRIFQDKLSYLWKFKERNGYEGNIAKFRILQALVVNPRAPSEYECICIELEYEGKVYSITLTMRQYMKREVLPYLSFIRRNPDCPEKYLEAAFYLAVQEITERKLLFTPKRSGWSKDSEGHLLFASAEIVNPQYMSCYPTDVRERQLLPTDRAIVDIAKDYSMVLPRIWQYKLLIALRIASLLLYFFEKEGIKPDQLIIVEPACPSAAKTAIALLKTQNYSSQVVKSLMSTKSELKKAFRDSNDSMVVLYDDARIENGKRHDELLKVVVDDLQGTNGIEDSTRHLTSIICENPCVIPEDTPAMYINLCEKVNIGDPDKLQRFSGEFDSALIQAIVNDPTNMLAFIKNALKAADIETLTIQNSENINAKKMIRVAISIMFSYGLISEEETKSILTWMKSGSDNRDDSVTAIFNDFINVLNELIATGIFKITTQKGFPYYKLQSKTIVYDGFWLNFEPELWDYILMRMRTCKKKYKILKALEKCMEKNHRQKEYKRNIDVDIAPKIQISISVFSIPSIILYPSNLEKVRELKYAGYQLTKVEAANIKLRPLVMNRAGTCLYGQNMEPDLNYHQLISGDSRSGKSTYEGEQAVDAAINDEQVLIVDNDGSWSEREVRKRLPESIIDKYFSFWSIPKMGLPVNLADVSDCDDVTEKKDRIKSVLSCAARSLGDKQGKVLYKRIGVMLKDKNDDINICDILAYLEKKDEVQKALRDKIEGVLEDFEELPTPKTSWREFFSSKKKIVVISTGFDSVAKGSYVTDMLLASYYAYKQHFPETRNTIILDEAQDLDISTDSAIDKLLRKGAKHGIRMLIATQHFSAVKEKLGKTFGNCRTLIIFRPEYVDFADISKLTGVDSATLASLEQGQCLVYGLLYDKTTGKNKQATVIGWTY